MRALLLYITLTALSCSMFGQSNWKGRNPLAQTDNLEDSQTRWQWLNPLPQGNGLRSVKVLDSTSYLAVGDGATVVKTTNRGRTWSVQHYAGGLTNNLWDMGFSDNNVVFAVGDSASIIRSDDGGENWGNIVYSGTGLDQLHAISFLGQCGLAIGDNSGVSIVVRTTDRGATWVRSDITSFPSTFFGVQLVSPTLAYACGDEGGADSGKFFKSTDGGINWATIHTFDWGTRCFRLYFKDSLNGIIAGQQNGAGEQMLKYTTDGGINWTSSQVADLVPPYQIWALRSGPNGVVTLGAMVGTLTPQGKIVLYQSTNMGRSWLKRYERALAFRYLERPFDCSVDNSGFGVAVTENGRLISTTDFGVSWSSDTTVVREELHGVAYFDSTTGIAISPDVIARTTDGGVSWTRNVIEGGYGVCVLNRTEAVMVGDGTFRTTDIGRTWQRTLPPSLGILNSVSFADENTGFSVGETGMILKTTNGGRSWFQLQSGVQQPPNLKGVSCIDAQRVVAVGGNRILRTIDGGSTWMDTTVPDFHWLFGIGFSGSGVGVAVGSLADVYGGIVYRTTDFGTNWVGREGITSHNQGLRSVRFIDSVQVIAVGAGDITSSSDAGQTWTLMNSPAANLMYAIEAHRSGTSEVVQAVGEGGTMIISAFSPLNFREWHWTGAVDSLWFRPQNWNPSGVPLPGDSVVIPQFKSRYPVIDSSSQVVIGSLNIRPGAEVTITPALLRFGILGDVTIAGSLRLLPTATTSIVVGGNWTVSNGSGFTPANSTVAFTGSGEFSQNFFNVILDTAAAMSSTGNVRIQNRGNILSDVTLRHGDTLSFSGTEPLSFVGSSKIHRGTIRRNIAADMAGRYRFESESTYVQFKPTGVRPTFVNVTVYPDTSPLDFGTQWIRAGGRADIQTHRIRIDSVQTGLSRRWVIRLPRPVDSPNNPNVDSSFVQRVYSVSTDSNAIVTLSFRYEPREILGNIREDSLQLYYADLPTEVGDGGRSIPTEYALEQNYPNPFNPTTMIKYELPLESHVTLQIYNILGQRVRTLVDELQPAGTKKAEWNSTNEKGIPVGSGVYFYRIEATSLQPRGSGLQRVMKMLLLK